MAQNTRSGIRAAMFAEGNKKPASEPLTLFGQEVEVRQPTLAQLNALSRKAADAKIPGVVNLLIEYCFIPGTDEKVFDLADAEQLASMPTGKWLNDFNTVVQKLSGIDIKAAEKNSEATA
jgi:hypothetical protein